MIYRENFKRKKEKIEMNTGFNDFTNLSSVTKTLCNRLIPTEITAKYIKEHGVIEADQERNMMSQ